MTDQETITQLRLESTLIQRDLRGMERLMRSVRRELEWLQGEWDASHKELRQKELLIARAEARWRLLNESTPERPKPRTLRTKDATMQECLDKLNPAQLRAFTEMLISLQGGTATTTEPRTYQVDSDQGENFPSSEEIA